MPRQELTPQQYERIRADIGIDAETFKRTQLGQFILGHCERMAEEYTSKLKRVDPNNVNLVREYQNEIWKHEAFENFLDEAISSGHAAVNNLQKMEAFEDDENNYVTEPPARGRDFETDFAEPPPMPGE